MGKSLKVAIHLYCLIPYLIWVIQLIVFRFHETVFSFGDWIPRDMVQNFFDWEGLVNPYAGYFQTSTNG